jgi:hypothetical protein
MKGVMTYYTPFSALQARGATGGNIPLDSGDTRVLKTVYRDGFIYAARDTGYPDATTTVTYDVIDASNMTLSSQTRLLNTHAFYPAFDAPATTAPGAPFATPNLITGTTTAPDGSLTFAGISHLKAGEDHFNGLPAPFYFCAYCTRWGDYFGGAVDPVTGGLWAYDAYAKPQLTGGFGQWGTWAGYFPWATTRVFSDVDPASAYSDYINVLSLWQITSGCAAVPAKFCPSDPVTRAQLAALVVRAMYGSTFPYTTTPYFTDVPATDSFFPYIQKLRDLGITGGCSPTTFCPNEPVTRWAAAVFLIRGKMASLFGDSFPYPTTPYFTDVPAGDVGFRFVQKMYELGITARCGPSMFCPNRTLTRQEVAVFLTRAFLN